MISQTSSSSRSGLEGAVAGEVAEGPLGDEVGVGEVERAQAPAVVAVPAGDLVVDERAELVAGRRPAMSSAMSLARAWTARSISTR